MRRNAARYHGGVVNRPQHPDAASIYLREEYVEDERPRERVYVDEEPRRPRGVWYGGRFARDDGEGWQP